MARQVTSEEVSQQLIVAEETEKKIDSARLGYRSASIRASLAYFVLDDMSRVDPMYQVLCDPLRSALFFFFLTAFFVSHRTPLLPFFCFC